MDQRVEIGDGFEISKYFDPDTEEHMGYTVTGPAAPQCKSPYAGRCGGLCAIKPYEIRYNGRVVKTYSVWSVQGEWPEITLSPSVACSCGGQHGFIRNGRWNPV